MVGSRRKYLIKCSTCADDPEMFGEGLFETSKESLDRGYKPCGCGSSFRYNEDQYKILMQRKSKELGVEFRFGLKNSMEDKLNVGCLVRKESGPPL